MCRSMRPKSSASVLDFFCDPARREPPSFGIGKIEIAKLRNSLGTALGMLFGGRIGLVRHLAKQPSSLLSRRLGRPRRAMPANGEPALAAFLIAIKQHVRDGLAILSARSKAGQRGVPNRLARPKRPHLSQSDPISIAIRAAFSLLVAALAST